MEGIRQYIVSVTAAAILCAVLRQLLPEKGLTSSLLKLVSGIFLAFVVISPVKNVDIDSFTVYVDAISLEGESLSAEGEDMAADAMACIIKDRTEAYILDKAKSLNASLAVEVELSADSLPVPETVRLNGTVSPYARSVLETMLAEELGIAKENQIWIS